MTENVEKKYSEDKKLIEAMELCFGEYMAGGLDEKCVRGDYKEVFSEMEDCSLEGMPYPEELCKKYATKNLPLHSTLSNE